MCGIAGSINHSLPTTEVEELLRHRGPDDQAAWQGGRVEFIHTRLAIQELSAAGRQPMHYGHLHIVFNGEIYNHIELRTRYRLTCQSHSDTETLLHLFERLGISMLDELDGMFAFALYDSRQEKLWLARDRAGEKPLYYARAGERFIFSSTIRVVQQQVKARVDDAQISLFLALGYLPRAQTPFVGINEVVAGHYLEVDVSTTQSRLVKWWSSDAFFQNTSRLDLSDGLKEVDRLLRLSVSRRLVSSDVEVGCFLSGGIDSGLVAAFARAAAPRLRTFTVSFDGLYNEAPLAAKVAHHLGTQHTELTISFDRLRDELDSIFEHYGEPIMDDSIIPSYYVSREAKRHVSVVLNGDGGDELFGGYRRYVPFAHLNLFADRGSSFFKAFIRHLPTPSDKMSVYNYVHRLLMLFGQPGKAAYYAATNDLLHREPHLFAVQPAVEHIDSIISNVFAQRLSALRTILRLDFELLLPAVLLVKMDVASMAHALETRSPFLSRELLSWAPGLPDHLKVRGTTTKFLLRQLAKRYLPAEIAVQPKRGFEVPLRQWVDGVLREMLHDRLGTEKSYVSQFLPATFIQRVLEKRVPYIPAEQRAKLLFSWLSLEVWHKQQQSW